jgi:hypothetical protein
MATLPQEERQRDFLKVWFGDINDDEYVLCLQVSLLGGHRDWNHYG